MNDRELERVLKALANKRRLSIVKFIKKSKSGNATVGEISQFLKLSFPSTSKHLSILASAGILEKEQVVLNMIYSFSKDQDAGLAKIISIV